MTALTFCTAACDIFHLHVTLHTKANNEPPGRDIDVALLIQSICICFVDRNKGMFQEEWLRVYQQVYLTSRSLKQTAGFLYKVVHLT